MSCFLVDNPKYLSWLAQNLAVCFSNFFLRSLTAPICSLRKFSRGTINWSNARSNNRSFSSSIAAISLPNSFKELAMTNSSSVWLLPIHSNLKLTKVCDSLLWALDKAGKKASISSYKFPIKVMNKTNSELIKIRIIERTKKSSNFSKCKQTLRFHEIFKLILLFSQNLSKSFRNLSNLVTTCQILSGLVQFCPNPFDLV